MLHRLVATVVLALAPRAIAQSAGKSSVDQAKRAALEKRVQAYWSARQGSDLGAAYAFYSPAFRAATPRGDFLRNFQRLIRFPPEKVTIDGVSMPPGAMEAIVDVRLDLTGEFEGRRIPISTTTQETWVFVERTWWKKDEPLKINV